jgi:DNA-directed RNA polymerase specialized sigma24 family protein
MATSPEPDRPNPAPRSFADLVAAVAKGDGGAFVELMAAYEKELTLMSRLLLGQHLQAQSDASDLVQTVHRRLLEGLQGQWYHPQGPDDLLTLVRDLLQSRASYLGRRTRRREELLLRALSEGVVRPAGEGLGQPFDRLLVQDLEELIGSVDSIDRQIVALRLEGYQCPEIAEKLNLKAPNVRTRLHRLRVRLAPEYLPGAPAADDESGSSVG